ncbi:DUF732 domain-containing protein [Microbacterium foliorum]
MKRVSIAAAVLVALTLTGCAGTPDKAADESAAPLVAESPAEVEGGDEATYLEDVRAALPSTTVIPDATDEQLLEAGWEACERREAGEPGDDISVIEGEERNDYGIYLDSQAIVGAARQTLCPVS